MITLVVAAIGALGCLGLYVVYRTKAAELIESQKMAEAHRVTISQLTRQAQIDQERRRLERLSDAEALGDFNKRGGTPGAGGDKG